MLKQLSRRPTPLINAFFIVILLLVAIFIGMRIGKIPITYQDLLTYAGLIAVAAILLQPRGVEIGFWIFIGAFAIGFRTVKVDTPFIINQIFEGQKLSQIRFSTGSLPLLKIHPLFPIVFLLLIVLLQRSITKQERVVGNLPLALLIFSLFWIWGWTRGQDSGIDWVDMFYGLMPFLMIFPIFIFTASILQKQSLWKPAFIVLLGTGTLIAFLGYLEVLFPNIRNLIPGYLADTTFVTTTEEGFLRAHFGFWGQLGATFVTALTMPAAIALWSWYKRPASRAIILICLILDVIAVYMGGYRSLWALMFVVTICLLLVRGNWVRALLFVMLMTIVFSLLPASTQTRFETFLSAMQGNYEDYSSRDRAGRAENAFQKIIRNPLGTGWSSSGLVHCDYLEITANLGIPAGIIFIVWYVTTLVRITRSYHESPDPLKLALVGSFLISGGLMLTQPMVYAPQYAAPVWFIWALVETKLRQIAKKESSYDANIANRAYPHLQLPSASTPVPGVREVG